jgi:hypothetical protein
VTRKPIFGFLWPKPDPHAPVDGAYRQVRPVRVSRRGPLRVAALLLLTLGVAAATGTVLGAALDAGFSWLVVVGAALVASGFALMLRAWVVGTAVTDEALVVETLWRRRVVPWEDVSALDLVAGSCPLLGTPLPVRGTRVVARTVDGDVPTHLYTTSPDYLGRAEAWDMAVLRLQRWREGR